MTAMGNEPGQENASAHTKNDQARSTNFVDYKPGDTILDRFKIIRLLGRGGMGSVYEIEHLNLQARYAMKFLSKSQTNDAAWRRFEIEARATSKLDHPNLIKVHDFGLLPDGQPFFIMDLVEGDTLAEILKKRGRLSVEQAIKMFIQVGFALSYAHSNGIVHRDIKPSNILIASGNAGKTEDSLVKLVDFGIAKLTGQDGFNQQTLTRTGEIFGSPLYMSPEQCKGTGVDQRSDLYSLGCVIFEALTGAPPLVGDSALATMMKHQTEIPPSLKEASMGIEFPRRIEQVVERLLAKNVEARYQSAQLLTADLVGLDTAQISTTALSPLPAAAAAQAEGHSKGALAFAALLIFVFGMAVGLLCPQISPPSFHKLHFKSDNPLISEQTISKNRHNPEGKQSPAEKKLAREFAVELKKSGYYSQPGKDNSRTFNFPNFAIGDYSHPGIKASAPPWVVPAFRGIRFKPSRAFKAHPVLFNRFRQDDINELNLNNSKTVASFIIGDFPDVDDVLPHITHLKSITDLACADTRINKNGFDCIDQLPNLVVLRLERSNMKVEDLAASASLPRLHFLSLQTLPEVGAVVRRICQSKTLTCLNLIDCHLDCAQLAQIARIPNLEILDISQNEKINDDCVGKLPAALKTLSLVGCNVTEKSAAKLSRLRQLKRLFLSSQNWTQAGRHHLKVLLPKTSIFWQ